MLLPKHLPQRLAAVLYPLVCALYGLAFGALYAPGQALLFGLNFEETLLWIAAGFPFDVTHAVSNFCMGLLILPLSSLLTRLTQRAARQ